MASPPPPPPPLIHLPPLRSSGTNSFPVIAIAVIGILATALLLISYYIFVIKCCLNWHRIDFLNRFFSRVRDPNGNIEPTTSAAVAPDSGGGAAQKGLDEAIIRSIPVIKFRKVSSERKVVNELTQCEPADSYECAVCLSEFEEGEKLRVIPNCCHAFHIDCIDVWLQSNANCPLCRSGISPASILYNAQMIGFPTSLHNKDNKNVNCEGDKIDQGNDIDEEIDNDNDDDFVVIEIDGNNLDEPRLVSSVSSSDAFCLPSKKGWKKLGHVYSMGDELIDMRKKDEEFQLEPIRRSISMDLSNERDFCMEIQECCRSNKEENEVSCGGSSSSSKVRRSIFSFGYGRSS